MKLQNKKTGEIAIFGKGIVDLTKIGCKNVADMMEQGWEDYEEPKGYWYYDTTVNRPDFIENCNVSNEDKELDMQIGNYFETREEAEKAVEKLKAWKRLKDKRFDKVFNLELSDALCGGKTVEFKLLIEDEASIEDIKLLFGGEE